jgi:hypothetical protein
MSSPTRPLTDVEIMFLPFGFWGYDFLAANFCVIHNDLKKQNIRNTLYFFCFSIVYHLPLIDGSKSPPHLVLEAAATTRHQATVV